MKLFLLCGPIAAGKTTYCLNAARQGILSINDDAIVNMLHANDYTLYQKQLKILYKNIENMIVGNVLSMNRSIIVDRGLNSNLSARKRWISLANSFDVPVEAIIFKNEGPEVHATRRWQSDSRGHTYDYWLKVATRHQEMQSEPTLDEGFDKVHRISYEEIVSGFVFE